MKFKQTMPKPRNADPQTGKVLLDPNSYMHMLLCSMLSEILFTVLPRILVYIFSLLDEPPIIDAQLCLR